MSIYLHRLGGWCFRKRRAVLSFWVVLLVAFGVSSQTIGGPSEDTFSIPGTPSQEALDLLNEKFPGTGGASARVVFAAPDGDKLTDTAIQAGVEQTLAEAAELDGVIAVGDPYAAGTIAPGGRIGFADVTYDVPAEQLESDQREALAEIAGPAHEAGAEVEFGGGLVEDTVESSTEALGVIVAFFVLAIVLGTFSAAWLPLLGGIFAVALALLGITTLAGIIEVSSTASSLAVMLGLAVGIDYALFILTRYRSGVEAGLEREEAAARAVGTAGSAVVFAGLTVVIALAGLIVVGIPFLTTMGLGAAATIVIAVAIALTFLPAMIGFAGNKIDPNRNTRLNRRLKKQLDSESGSRRWASVITRRPIPVAIVATVLLVGLTLPVTHLKLGLPDAGSQPEDTTGRMAYDLLTDGFGAGFNGPFTVVVDAPGEEKDVVANRLRDGLMEVPGIVAVGTPVTNQAGDVTIVTATPESGPDSDETKDLVADIRDRADLVKDETGINVLVTGQAVVNIDISDRLGSALPTYLAVVVGLAMILLTMVFRSVLVPLKAALGFLLSLGAAMGLVVFIFQDGNFGSLFQVTKEAPIVSFFPVLLIGILFGLAMDYEVFLVSRMRERFIKGGDATDAIVTGMDQSGRVVSAAAVIMIAVFGGFIFGDDPIIKSFGLGLAAGVAADAFIVRMTLVPAVMQLLGNRAWALPAWLDKRLPNVDIEGEALRERLER